MAQEEWLSNSSLRDDKELSELPIDSVKDRVARLDLDSYSVAIYDSGGEGEKIGFY